MTDPLETMVARIDERTAYIHEKMSAHCTQIADHEKRIGCLESFEDRIYLVSTLVVIIIGWLIFAGYIHA